MSRRGTPAKPHTPFKLEAEVTEFAKDFADEVSAVRCAFESPACAKLEGGPASAPASHPGWEQSLLSHTPSKNTPSKLTYLKGKSRIARRLHMSGDPKASQRQEKDVSAQDLCKKASDLLRKKDVMRARLALERAVNVDAGCVEAHCNLGLLLQSHQGDIAGATKSYRRALVCNPRHTDTLCNYGFLHLRSGPQGAAQAQELFDRCLEIDATHVGALCNYGLLKQTLLRDCAGAEDLYQRALAKDPTHVHSLFNLANLQREGNRMVEAMETYRRVLSIDCANVASMCNLAILEQRVCRNLPAAERYFMLCLECDPFHCAALANYASLKLEQRDSASAHRLYLRCLAVDGQNLASLMGLALLLRDTNREAALAYCQEALGIRPDSIWLQNLESSMKGSMGKHETLGGIEDTCASTATTQPSSTHSTMLSSRDEASPVTRSPTKSVAERLREVEALQLIGPGGLSSPAAAGAGNPAAAPLPLPTSLAGLQISNDSYEDAASDDGQDFTDVMVCITSSEDEG